MQPLSTTGAGAAAAAGVIEPSLGIADDGELSMTATTPVQQQGRQLSTVACGLVGVACAVAGLLPWLITGMRLPRIRNPWVTGPMLEQMPVVLLPFFPSALALMAAVLVVGSALAGVTTRSMRARTPRHGLVAVVLGVLLVQAGAVLQTAVALRGGFTDLGPARLLAVSVALILIGVLALVLIARAPRAGALIGLGIGALMVAEWMTPPFARLAISGHEIGLTLVDAVTWLPPVLIGVAIAWAGVTTVGRVAAAVVTLLGLWLVPALLTAASTAGSHGSLSTMLEWTMLHIEAFAEPDTLVPRVLVAVAVAAAGLLVRAVVLPRIRARTSDDDGAVTRP